MADTKSKKAQVRYKVDYKKHIRSEPCLAVSDYVFVKHPPLLASVADSMAYEGYVKLLHCRIRPYRDIVVGPKYSKIDKDSIRNTV